MDSDPEPSPEAQAVNEQLEQFELRIDPQVWVQIEQQAWFNKGTPTEDGLRVISLLSDYYLGERPYLSLQVLAAYPQGVTAEIKQILLGLENGYLIHNVATQPWFLDGADEYEKAFMEVLAAAWARTGAGWTFNQVMFDVMESSWFMDGLDEKEHVVVNAAGALFSRNQERALQLIAGLESDAFLYENVTLTVSGEKTLIVTASAVDLGGQLQPALDLVKRWMQGVEDFAGPYAPQYVLVSVVERSETVCGTTQAERGDVPGFVSLHVGCVEDGTVVHELAHIFVGTGPIWFSEGIADLAVLHLTGQSGNYLDRPADGLIDVRARRERGEEGDEPTPDYLNQGSLGAKFLRDVYELLGSERTSGVIKEITSGNYPKEGPLLLRLFLDGTPAESLSAMNALLEERFISTQ